MTILILVVTGYNLDSDGEQTSPPVLGDDFPSTITVSPEARRFTFVTARLPGARESEDEREIRATVTFGMRG